MSVPECAQCGGGVGERAHVYGQPNMATPIYGLLFDPPATAGGTFVPDLASGYTYAVELADEDGEREPGAATLC